MTNSVGADELNEIHWLNSSMVTTNFHQRIIALVAFLDLCRKWWWQRNKSYLLYNDTGSSHYHHHRPLSFWRSYFTNQKLSQVQLWYLFRKRFRAHNPFIVCELFSVVEARGSRLFEDDRRREEATTTGEGAGEATTQPSKKATSNTNTSKQCIHPPLGTLVVSTNSSTPLHIEHHVIFWTQSWRRVCISWWILQWCSS